MAPTVLASVVCGRLLAVPTETIVNAVGSAVNGINHAIRRNVGAGIEIRRAVIVQVDFVGPGVVTMVPDVHVRISASPFARVKHGMYGTPTYKSWQKMKERCLNKNSVSYSRYGAVGITVCERWMTFENFFADMGVRPQGTSIDRWPNRNGNYEPGNCRWATLQEQGRNRNDNRYLTIGGITKAAPDWADEVGLKANTLLARVDQGRMSPEQALSHKKYSHQTKRDQSKVNFACGERKSALKNETVLEIFANEHGLKNIELARQYGVTATVVSYIRSGRTWKHLTQFFTPKKA